MTDRVVPYPGLRPFEEKDRAIFFGREAQTVSVLSLLEENQFVAVVGSSGSGKSSLILAGAIPAVREGFLRNTRNWKIVVLKPGSDPTGNLARALEREGVGHEQRKPALVAAGAGPMDDRVSWQRGDLVTAPPVPEEENEPESLVERLHASDSALINLLAPPTTRAAPEDRGELAASSAVTFAPAEEADGSNVLIVVDQFEELFTFRRVEAETGTKAARFAPRDEAATFVRLLLHACAEPGGRIAVIITMRSDFIGDCDAFLELPELVSKCQFLVPRLDRSQMREAIERPGEVEDLGYAPFVFEEGLVNRIIAEAGDRIDQLPLMQHALMRTWNEAGGPDAPAGESITLTSDHYLKAGKITGALSKHANSAWAQIKDDLQKARLTRQIFLLLSDVHADGKIVRRRPLLAEVQAVTGAGIPAIEEIVRLFQSDERNFLLPPLKDGKRLTDEDHLDICHEALLRQWTEFGNWLLEETEWKVWLQELSQAAKDYKKDPKTERWHGNDLRGAEDWIKAAQPSEAWARRHGVQNWDACLQFLELSREEEIEEKENAEAADRQAREEKEENRQELLKAEREAREQKERRQKNLLRGLGALLAAFFILGIVITALWKSALRNEDRAKQASTALLVLIKANGEAAIGIVESSKAAVTDYEQQAAKLTAEIEAAATESPPEKTALEEFEKTATAAADAVSAIDKFASSIRDAARTSHDQSLIDLTATLEKQASESRERLSAPKKSPAVANAATKALTERLAHAEYKLDGLIEWKAMTQTVIKSRASDISAATAQLNAIDAIRAAALVLGFDSSTNVELTKRIAAVKTTLGATYLVQKSEIKPGSILAWKPADAFRSLSLGGKINRVRFAPKSSAESPLLAAACDDSKVWFWRKGGVPRGVQTATHPLNDIAFSPQGDSLAVASNGSTVRILHWSSTVTPESDRAEITNSEFQKHSDTITDVEFSRGGDYVVSSSADRTVRVFEPDMGMVQRYYTSPPLPGIVTSVTFHLKGNLVVSGCDDGGVRLHTIVPPAIALLGKFEAPARRPEFSADGKFIIAASGDKTARVWPILAPLRELVRITHEAPVTQATFRPVTDADRYVFVTTATNGEVRCVRVTDPAGAAKRSETILDPHHPGAAVFATWSEDGNWLATVILWKWINDSPVAKLRMVDLNPATSRAEFSPDARLLVTYGADQVAQVWDLSKLPEP